MNRHPGWLCVLLLGTPVVYVIGLSCAVEFADLPRFWALAFLAVGTSAYILVALKAVPRSDDAVGEAAQSPRVGRMSEQLR